MSKALNFNLEAYSLWPRVDSDAPDKPSVKFMPLALRKKLSLLSKLALNLINDVLEGDDRVRVPVVLSSRHGESGTIVELLRSIGSGQASSPMLFSRSVHNASIGLWSIAAESQVPHISISAMGSSFRAGLLEALLRLDDGKFEKVLFVYVDDELPEEFVQFLGRPLEPYGGAFLITKGDELSFSDIFLPAEEVSEVEDFKSFTDSIALRLGGRQVSGFQRAEA